MAAGRRFSIGGGLAGGGTVVTDGGEAQFSVFATNAALAPDAGPTARGQLVWVDGDLSLESATITEYGPIEGDPSGRRLRGTVTAGGPAGDGAAYPFTLLARDLGSAGEKGDTIRLLVGAADTATPTADKGGFSYQVVDTPLSGGDLQLLTFEEVAVP